MERMRLFRGLALMSAAFSLAGALTPARAQADPDDVNRAVARISAIEGNASVRRGDSGDWVAAAVNAPLLAGDEIATGAGSRVEIQFDADNVIRLSGDTELRLPQLDYAHYQLELARGTATYSVLRKSDVDIEVDTPNISVRPQREGSYRIQVDDSGQTEVTARSGDVEVFTPSGSSWVRSGESMVARGQASNPEYQMVKAPPLDAWDRWNQDRNRAELASASYRHVPSGVYGVSDLDRYGRWEDVDGYGYCWRPTLGIGASWSPYGEGRWVWEDWYGWTWVSYDPWGWAPYHYGRWFYNSGWYWYPGVRNVRHYWSPALVAFFGWGGGGIGIGFNNVGWVPLAPYETFHPWWGRGYYGRGSYMQQNINITNVNIANVYRNSRVQNGIIGMGRDDFERGRFQNVQRFNGQQVREAGVMQGPMPITPRADNLRFTDRQVTAAPRAARDVTFFSRGNQQARPQVERIPFAQQQSAFEQRNTGAAGLRAAPNAQPGRQGGQAPQAGSQATPRDVIGRQAAPAGRANTAASESAVPNGGVPNPRVEAAPAQNRGGWQRFGTPSNAPNASTEARPVQPAPQRQVVPQQQRDPGWNRFGDPAPVRSEPQPQTQAPQRNAEPRQQTQGPASNRDVAPRSSEPPAARQAQPDSAPRNNAPAFRQVAPRETAPMPQRQVAPREAAPVPQRQVAPREAAPVQQRQAAPREAAPRPQAAPREAAPRGNSGNTQSSGGGEARTRAR